MTRKELVQQIKLKQSFLCVGLDIDTSKIPVHLLNSKEGHWDFLKEIIDVTLPYTVAYKPNTAFFECMGIEGWHLFNKVVQYLQNKSVLIIADAKRGDIGNTSQKYAETFFHTYSCDAITVAPYMGKDSVAPFLDYKGKWTIVLGLTSNTGSEDFQQQTLQNEKPLYTQVIETVASWGTEDNTMFVIGATKGIAFESIRKVVPHHFLLVPGVGAQGGDLATVAQYGLNEDCGLLVNASRSILYASSDNNFASAAAEEALTIQCQMAMLLKAKGITS